MTTRRGSLSELRRFRAVFPTTDSSTTALCGAGRTSAPTSALGSSFRTGWTLCLQCANSTGSSAQARLSGYRLLPDARVLGVRRPNSRKIAEPYPHQTCDKGRPISASRISAGHYRHHCSSSALQISIRCHTPPHAHEPTRLALGCISRIYLLFTPPNAQL
jgi:hypothetical protein